MSSYTSGPTRIDCVFSLILKLSVKQKPYVCRVFDPIKSECPNLPCSWISQLAWGLNKGRVVVLWGYPRGVWNWTDIKIRTKKGGVGLGWFGSPAQPIAEATFDYDCPLFIITKLHCLQVTLHMWAVRRSTPLYGVLFKQHARSETECNVESLWTDKATSHKMSLQRPRFGLLLFSTTVK